MRCRAILLEGLCSELVVPLSDVLIEKSWHTRRLSWICTSNPNGRRPRVRNRLFKSHFSVALDDENDPREIDDRPIIRVCKIKNKLCRK